MRTSSEKLFSAKFVILFICIMANAHANECRRVECFDLNSSAPILRKMKPTYFGFNLEWLEFQLSIWRGGIRFPTLESLLLDYLSPFEGAVYRYPGGLNSNNFRFSDSIASIEGRPFREHVSWAGAVKVEFGLREYCEFLRKVNGAPWYVVNLFGEYKKEINSDELADDFFKIQDFFKREDNCTGQEIYWELGNELDRDVYKWSSGKYINRIERIAKKSKSIGDNFVFFQEEYSPRNKFAESAREYNSVIIKYASTNIVNLAMHAYYDGAPVGPPVDWFKNKIQSVINEARTHGARSRLWVTEHGRVPSDAYSKGGWKKSWPATYDFDSALSVADMLIALSSIPEVEGLFVHALHAGEGPWKLFELSSDGYLAPTPPMIVLSSLRKYMQADVLYSSKILDERSGSLNYARVTVMSNDVRKLVSIWAVNKDLHEKIFKLKTSKSNFLKFKRCEYFSELHLNSGNTSSSTCLRFLSVDTSEHDSVIKIVIPPRSVIGMEFNSAEVTNVE